MSDQSYRNCLLALTGGLLFFFCITCFGVIAISGGVIALGEAVANWPTLTLQPTISLPTETAAPAQTQAELAPIPPPTQIAAAPIASPTPSPVIPIPRFTPAAVIVEPATQAEWEALDRFWHTYFPPRDYYETAYRLSNRRLVNRTVTAPVYSLGSRQTFFTDQGEVQAVLVAATEHVYFWVEVGLNLDPTALSAAAQRFESEYYPRIAYLFGQEWRPGMDNDPRFSILHLSSTQGNELGYFDSSDQYPLAISHGSNQQEIFYLNMASLTVGEDLYFGTMVHEYQHLIQWWLDPNETIWLNEGLSQLAETYVGLDTVSIRDYLDNPGIQLNSWPDDKSNEDAIYAHYAASYLFVLYLWEQLGDAAIQELARHPANGLASVRQVLAGYRPDLTLEQFLGQFAAALWLDDPAVGSAYHFAHQSLRRPAAPQILDVPITLNRAVNQYGLEYLPIRPNGRYTIRFAGDNTAALIGAPPRSGDKMWLAPSVDDLNAQLTARFDLTGLPTASLEFWAWYELEEEYDFAYVTISKDEGQTWDLLFFNGAAVGEYGPAFNGYSGDVAGHQDGWIRTNINLNRYTGQPVLLRFEMLTDGGISGRGFAIDDLSIPELNYATDFETDDGMWQADGFVWTGHQLPQQWVVQWIQTGASPQITPLPLDIFNQAEWVLETGSSGGVLIIMPVTPYIYQPAAYWLEAVSSEQ